MLDRISILKDKMLSQPRYVSIEQALIITRTYQENEDKSIPYKRALSLYNALNEIEIGMEPEELIVGNRTKGVRYGVVFPESGISWVDREFETIPTRPQDKFNVHSEDIETFRKVIVPYWKGKSLEDVIKNRFGEEISAISKVVKVNQTDHAQGHICPNVKEWLELGPQGYIDLASSHLKTCSDSQKEFYECVILVMQGVQKFMLRYHDLALEMNKKDVAEICEKLAYHPASTFHEALQSLWFLFVVLHMESNASSFSKGSGMPQFFNDKAIIKAMEDLGISHEDAMDYAIVGCVELTTQGNNLGWSDSGMFNMNKVLELTLNHGRCLLTGKQMGLDYGSLSTYTSFSELESAFEKMMDYFIDKMIPCLEEVEKAHIDILPTAFLSSVIDDCMEKGMDVTRGGAHYNLSGIQMIQVANLADSLAALKKLVYDERKIGADDLENALQSNFVNNEVMRQMLQNRAPKYGNDVDWVDELGAKWALKFRNKLRQYTNYRNGEYHTGMYTVSAHVPMGENVGASCDGRLAKTPLADGGLSAVYGRDLKGPTAVLKSVSHLDNSCTTNGGLLNMKFLPEFFKTESGIDKFANFMRTFVDLEIPHIQFNVVRKEDLLNAKAHPDQYRSLTVRVAGYTAYFTELAGELQDEIIARTSYDNI